MNAAGSTPDEIVDDLIAAEENVREPEEEARRGVVPTLVVALGGTGVQVAARLKRKLLAHYNAADLRSEMIKFLLLDTIALSKQSDKEIKRLFSEAEEEYVSLAENFNAYAYLQQNYSKDRDLREWWDNRYTVSPQYQEWGAKRVRQLGRLFLHHKHLQVESIVQHKVADTCTLYEELVRGQNLADVGANFRVYVVTSSCGGTGSGIFFDILYKIWRAVLSQGRVPEVRAFMFMPGIYEAEARKRSLELVEAHRANAYAFFKELDFFISAGADPSRHILDSQTRDSSQKINIPTGSLLKYGYLIDKQLGNLGNLDRPDDAYDLVSDAMFQMVITPVGQEEEGVGLTNIDAIVDPSHTREGKRTAYSSLGLSRILFPRSSIQAHLTYKIIRDLVFDGLLANQTWMEQAARQDNRLAGLVRRIGDKNLDILEEAAAPGLEAISQCPSQADIQSGDMSERLDALVREKDINESRISDALGLMERQYASVSAQAKTETRSAIVNLVNNCEYGLAYSRKILMLAKKELRGVLDGLRSVRAQYEEAAAQAEHDIERDIKAAEKLLARRAVIMRTGQANRLSSAMAVHIRNLTEARILGRLAAKKETLIEELSGEEQVVEQRLENDEVVVGRGIGLSVMDAEIKKIGKIIERLTRLAEKAGSRAKEPAYSQADRGATITTQVFPRHIADIAKFSTTRDMYESAVNSSTIFQHIKTLLSKVSEPGEYSINGIYSLSEDAQAPLVERLFVMACSSSVRSIFGEFLGQSLVEVVEKSVGRRRFADQVMGNLFELSQPCWNYEGQKALDPGLTELPRTYSLGYRDPQALPMPGGRNQPGLVKTDDDHEVTLLQAQHGLPLFALRVLPIMRADYRKWMRISAQVGTQPLHLHQSWSQDIDGLPDLKATTQIADEVLLDFSLALFSDYLVTKKDQLLTKMIVKRPIYKGPVRGFVFTSDGRRYFVSRVKIRGEKVELQNVENISSTGRLDAAEAYANHADAGQTTAALVKMLERAKQYQLIPELEAYLTAVVVPEAGQAEDDEERHVLEREYTVLSAYLEGLRRQQRRGLPLAS